MTLHRRNRLCNTWSWSGCYRYECRVGCLRLRCGRRVCGWRQGGIRRNGGRRFRFCGRKCRFFWRGSFHQLWTPIGSRDRWTIVRWQGQRDQNRYHVRSFFRLYKPLKDCRHRATRWYGVSWVVWRRRDREWVDSVRIFWFMSILADSFRGWRCPSFLRVTWGDK